MFGLQTVSCLHDIPVIRSSTDKLQDVYAKAKGTSVLIRLPCSLAETVADTSLKVALAVVNPFFKPISGPVRALDEYAVQKLRQIETKYPVINTRPEDVVNTFNEKTEPVRTVMNSVKDSTTTTIQQGKETVTNVASGVADSVFSFCGTRAPGAQQRKTNQSRGLTGLASAVVGSLFNYTYQTVQPSLVWFRMLTVFFLLKVKQVNDLTLSKVQYKSYVPAFPLRVLIVFGGVLDYVVSQVKPDDRTLAELKRSKQQTRLNQQQQQQQQQTRQSQQQQQTRQSQQQQQQKQFYSNRQSVNNNAPVTTRQSVTFTQQGTTITRNSNSNQYAPSQPDYSNQYTPSQPDYSNMTDAEELNARLANADFSQSTYNIENGYTDEPVDVEVNGDIAQLHQRIHPTDVELLYSRLPDDILPEVNDDEPLTSDQQQLHARIIADELENQGYSVDN